MKKDTIEDTNYFDGVDWDAPSVNPPIIKKLQANAKKAELLAFDSDVVDWVAKQDNDTKHYLNDVIRSYMSFKNNTMTKN